MFPFIRLVSKNIYCIIWIFLSYFNEPLVRRNLSFLLIIINFFFHEIKRSFYYYSGSSGLNDYIT